MTSAPRLDLLALGGTIAAPVDAAGSGARMTLTADDVLGDLAARAGVEVRTETVRSLPSSSLGFDDLRDVAARIASSTADGVVVTVGTDALEEVAFALDSWYGGEAPVVVTGAMRNVGLPGADGPGNLLAALRVAADPAARGQGVLVVMGDEIHLARYVRKTHSSSPSTFRSANVGAVGWIVEGRVRIPLARRYRPAPLPIPSRPVPPVALVRVSLGDDPALITAALSTGCAGMVLETFGAGHVAEAALPAVRAAAEKVPVVFASRTGAGEPYAAVGAFPGSERDLLAAGLVPARELDGTKARILLALLLAAGADAATIRDRFAAG